MSEGRALKVMGFFFSYFFAVDSLMILLSLGMDEKGFPIDDVADVVESKGSYFWGEGALIVVGDFTDNELKLMRYMYENDAYIDDIALVLRREPKSIENKVRRVGLRRPD